MGFKSCLSPLVVDLPPKAASCPQLKKLALVSDPIASPEASPRCASIATLGCIYTPWVLDAEEVEEVLVGVHEEVEDGRSDAGSDCNDVTEGCVRESKSRRRRRRGGKGKVFQPPAEPNASTEKPCEHNSWDNVRVKKDKTTLRCRVCQLQWKVDHQALLGGMKCHEFCARGTCKAGDQCPKVHIHRFKQGLNKRKAIWGTDLLVARRQELDDDGCTTCTAPPSATEKPVCFPVPSPDGEDSLPRFSFTLGDSSMESVPMRNAPVTPERCLPREGSPAPSLGCRRPSESTAGGTTEVSRRYSHQPYDFGEMSESHLLCPEPSARPSLATPSFESAPRLHRQAPSPINVVERSPSALLAPSAWTPGNSAPSPCGSNPCTARHLTDQRRLSAVSITSHSSQGSALPPSSATLFQAAKAWEYAAMGYQGPYQPMQPAPGSSQPVQGIPLPSPGAAGAPGL